MRKSWGYVFNRFGKSRQIKVLKALEEDIATLENTLQFLDAPQLSSSERGRRVSKLQQRLALLRRHRLDMRQQLRIEPALPG